MVDVSQAVKKRATYADVLAAPEHKVAEVIDGELHVFPRPAGPHSVVYSRLGALLGSPFDLARGGPGGWRIIDEPELHFGEGNDRDILVPDLAGWRRERMPARPAGAYITTPPDWVCEILSPSTTPIDRAKKLPIYLREGVPFAWLIDPIAKTIEAYERDGARWTLASVHRGGSDAVRVAPFDAVELDLVALFDD